MRELVISRQARHFLNHCPTLINGRISEKLEIIRMDPFMKSKLQGEDLYKIRVGDYRILFRIENDAILVEKIGHRKNVYKHL